ncbi:MAG: hydrogenase iron-sulfur subunit [Candidatus Lokiarchaeota archaeon]|nr:hydrogenase iron-sulfur subunit [Candidatus Lokiarchaeota archaeon]
MAYKHLSMLKKIFVHLGISEERIQQYFCSAADVEKFINSVKDISQKIHALPPLPKKTE